MTDNITASLSLYAWQPKGCGPLSFFVAAETEAEARAAVEQKIKTLKNPYDWDAEGWDTDGYTLTVVCNYND